MGKVKVRSPALSVNGELELFLRQGGGRTVLHNRKGRYLALSALAGFSAFSPLAVFSAFSGLSAFSDLAGSGRRPRFSVFGGASPGLAAPRAAGRPASRPRASTGA